MLEKILLPLALASLMFGLGMSLTKDDFMRVAARKRVVFLGLASIVFVMPVFAFFLANALQLGPVLTMGLILLVTCPGGMFSNMVTHLAKGETALSVTLTVLSSFLYVLAVPVVVSITSMNIAGDGGQLTHLFYKILFEIALVVLLPLSLGMWLRRLFPNACVRREGLVRTVSSIFIAVVFLVLGIEQFQVFADSGIRIVLAVLAMNLIGWAMSGLLAIVFRFSTKEFIAVGVEHSIRQEGTGVFIAVTVIGNPQMVAPLLLNSLIGLLVSSMLTFAIQRRQKSVTGLAALNA